MKVHQGLNVSALPKGLLLEDGSLPGPDALTRIDTALGDIRRELTSLGDGSDYSPRFQSLRTQEEALVELAARVRRLADPEHQALVQRLRTDDTRITRAFWVIYAVAFLIALIPLHKDGLLGVFIAAWLAFLLPAILAAILVDAAKHVVLFGAVLAAPFRLILFLVGKLRSH